MRCIHFMSPLRLEVYIEIENSEWRDTKQHSSTHKKINELPSKWTLYIINIIFNIKVTIGLNLRFAFALVLWFVVKKSILTIQKSAFYDNTHWPPIDPQRRVKGRSRLIVSLWRHYDVTVGQWSATRSNKYACSTSQTDRWGRDRDRDRDRWWDSEVGSGQCPPGHCTLVSTGQKGGCGHWLFASGRQAESQSFSQSASHISQSHMICLLDDMI